MNADMLCVAVNALVECGYATDSTVVELEDCEKVLAKVNINIPPKEGELWETVDPFSDTLTGRRQLEALIGHYMVSTIVDVEISGWWIECYTHGLCTLKNPDVRANEICISYAVKYEGKYRREAEMRCVGLCLGEIRK